MPESTLITSLLGISALLLGLALLVQVLQEMYKFLTKSKSRAYTGVLLDVLGPWAHQLLRPEAIPNLQVRGPLQFLRLRPKGLLLPLDREDLVEALERTAPGWVQRALQMLRREVDLQKGLPKGEAHSPSVGWRDFVDEMDKSERDKATPGYGNLLEVREFFEARGAGAGSTASSGANANTQNAARLLQEFREQFLSPTLDAGRVHPQLMRNFEYRYQRRNLRHSFTIAFIVALLFQFPITAIYHRANAMTVSEAVAAAEQALALNSRADALNGDDAEKLKRAVGELEKLLALHQDGQRPKMCSLLTWQEVKALWAGRDGGILAYLLHCLVTAVLISFGAPFWNDLAGALLRMKKGGGRPTGGSGTESASTSGTTSG